MVIEEILPLANMNYTFFFLLYIYIWIKTTEKVAFFGWFSRAT